jgi:hypothetical protein
VPPDSRVAATLSAIMAQPWSSIAMLDPDCPQRVIYIRETGIYVKIIFIRLRVCKTLSRESVDKQNLLIYPKVVANYGCIVV